MGLVPIPGLALTACADSGGPPGNDDALKILRERMVAQQLTGPGRDIRDPRVLEAMRKVPRHLFMPENVRHQAYEDRPLPIGHGQTISQPFIVAFMSEKLEVDPGEKVLEIGTGSGYQAAILAEMGAEVYSIEIVEPLAESARESLDLAGYKGVRTKAGDGFKGWPEHAPFDLVIVTCSPDRVPQPLVNQLRDGGRMVVPVGEQGEPQQLFVLEKHGDAIERQAVLPVRFVPMTGEIENR